ncbi:MAG TPA: DUF948 domain-containing protein [Steroidobacteraceae bacterium]|nr:DUF948 domain-containing protein [Steroidobacteraceae bacterium]
MSEPVVSPAPVKRPAAHRGILIVSIIALIFAVLAAYEYQHSAQLNTMLKQANDQVTGLQTQLTTVSGQLAAATTKINELKQHNMPVTLIFRRAGNGLVTIFRNNAPTTFDVSVLLINPVNHHSREASLSIPPNGTQSIGEMEGWVFEPGQHIQLTNTQFGTVDYVVPEQP